MPLDAYSLCPGGTGKKIKFCCPQLIGDLEKIDRMLRGEQLQACLQHIESLESANPERPCLMSIKAMLLRNMGRIPDAVGLARRFVELNPDNPVALAEASIAATAEGDIAAAVRWFQKALRCSENELYDRVYEAMATLSPVLLESGEFRAARAILQLQAAITHDDPTPMEYLSQLNRSSAVPLILKDDPALAEAAADAPWKEAFDAAMAPVRRGHWLEGSEKLAELAEQYPESPDIWRNLGILRGWLADTPGSIEAFRKYARLDVPLEDAVEARATAMFLDDDPLGDQVDVLHLVYPVDDEEALIVALSSVPWVVQGAANLPAQAEGEVPPKAAFFILDRELPSSAEGLQLADVPRVLGQALLYGRQTDCAGRFEMLGVTSSNRQALQDRLNSLQIESLASASEETPVAQLSASHELLQRPWRLPRDIDRDTLFRLVEEHQRKALLEWWPEQSLGLLEGRTPRQAAEDSQNQVDLLAAIMLMEFWSQQTDSQFDFNQMRAELGLPTLGSIDPQQTPVERLPLVRLKRIDVEKASDEGLRNGYRRAVVFGATEALQGFAEQVVQRPAFAGTDDYYRALSLLSRIEPDAEKALGYLRRGRDESEAAGQSSAPWDLMELSLQIEHGNPEEASRLVNHLQSQHINEPGVAEALAQVLIQIGALRPDGTPAGPAPGAVPPSGAPAAAEGEPGKLWTPDSQKPSGEKPGIWTPGMD